MPSRVIAMFSIALCVQLSACDRASTEAEPAPLAVSIAPASSSFSAGAIATFTLSNQSAITVTYGDCDRALERLSANGWVTATETQGCYLVAKSVSPGGQVVLEYYLSDALSAGTYRLRDVIAGQSAPRQLVRSTPFSVVR